MTKKIVTDQFNVGENRFTDLFQPENIDYRKTTQKGKSRDLVSESLYNQTEILFMTSYPPRECGIATYSHDLIRAIENKFCNSLSIKVCALETGDVKYSYPKEVRYILNTSVANGYEKLAETISDDNRIKMVLIQHEFGFFREQENAFIQFLYNLSKPVIIVFHTVLPNPDEHLKSIIGKITKACESIIVMTNTSASILVNDYGVPTKKISVIAHGTHLVPHLSEIFLKRKYELTNRTVLSTFGLLSSGKSIETTIEALPAIVKQYPEVVFLVIGKTHPEVVKNEGENYRESLQQRVEEFGLQNHVVFINNYLALPELLEYLQLTDIYLFTSNDPNQAVSGTFAYAMSCACPIISTPIPHALEVLTEDTGIIFDFGNSVQLADAIIRLLNNKSLRNHISVNSLQKIVSTAWENSAVAHAILFGKIVGDKMLVKYNFPEIKLDHMEKMTTETGIIQFSKINQPDLDSGYTLDDNARALIASCMYFKMKADERSLFNIHKYFNFIKFCQQPNGRFLNYVDRDLQFTDQNDAVNLDDANGRAIWALGYIISLSEVLPHKIIVEARIILEKALPEIEKIHSTRAMAFAIKGIYYYHKAVNSPGNLLLIQTFANRLIQMYIHESTKNWEWFESYLTYANSILSEALLYAWELTGEPIYKEIAIESLDFLMIQTFNENGIEVISNKKWLQKGEVAGQYGEQPIDVAYTIMTLNKFYRSLKKAIYLQKLKTAFDWFLGSNRLRQIIYNPCTGGCYDGLEEKSINLNQGAESTVSYLLARLVIDKYKGIEIDYKEQLMNNYKLKAKPHKRVNQPSYEFELNPIICLSLPSHSGIIESSIT